MMHVTCNMQRERERERNEKGDMIAYRMNHELKLAIH